jgi:hypothetical protein
MITVSTTTEDERQDVLDAFLDCLGGHTDFVICLLGKVTDERIGGVRSTRS